MKKLFFIVGFIVLIGCSNLSSSLNLNNTFESSDVNITQNTEIKSLYYSTSTIGLFDIPNHKTEKIIDLENNQYLFRQYNEDENIPKYEIKKDFSKENKDIFIKNIIKYDIYSIAGRYWGDGNDGFTWEYSLIFSDNIDIKAYGYNDFPEQSENINIFIHELVGTYFFN